METDKLFEEIDTIIYNYYEVYSDGLDVYKTPDDKKEFLLKLSAIFSDGKYRNLIGIMEAESEIEKAKSELEKAEIEHQQKIKKIESQIERLKEEGKKLTLAESMLGVKIKGK